MSSLVVELHGKYLSEGISGKVKASTQLLEEMGKIGFLTDVERARIIISAIKTLVATHHNYDNFYNEPPHAKRLLELRSQTEIPPTVQREFVTGIITCAIGNDYGVSRMAEQYYMQLVTGFSPKEISIMLDLLDENNIVSRRCNSNKDCRSRFTNLLKLIDINSVPKSYQPKYQRLSRSQ